MKKKNNLLKKVLFLAQLLVTPLRLPNKSITTKMLLKIRANLINFQIHKLTQKYGK